MLNTLRQSSFYRTRFRPPLIGRRRGPLAEDQARSVFALAEVIYDAPDEEGRNLLHDSVREWIEARTIKDGFLDLYQNGTRALSELTRSLGYDRSFASLSLADRRQVCESPEWTRWHSLHRAGPRSQIARRIRLLLEGLLRHRKNRNAFYLHGLRQDLVQGIFSSPLGWTVVGYRSWPFQPGSPHEYTEAPPSGVKLP
jgi:hypothetical protein